MYSFTLHKRYSNVASLHTHTTVFTLHIYLFSGLLQTPGNPLATLQPRARNQDIGHVEQSLTPNPHIKQIFMNINFSQLIRCGVAPIQHYSLEPGLLEIGYIDYCWHFIYI